MSLSRREIGSIWTRRRIRTHPPPTERKSYAPDPIGKPSEPREVPPDVAETLHMINYFQITNEGSLIDLLV